MTAHTSNQKRLQRKIKNKKVKSEKTLDALIFIDTNIYLDFYRAHSSLFEKSMIQRIDQISEKIIITDQVLMEYKKNRQNIILSALTQIKNPSWDLSMPSILSDTKPFEVIKKRREDIQQQINKLKKQAQDLLQNPKTKDPIYKCLHRLAQKSHLNKESDNGRKIKEYAHERFLLGYPPRKDKESSFGDAINWEWIIHCAQESGKHIIIVSRDTDYGIEVNKNPVLNDWLEHEFKERVGMRRKIILTNKLSDALKLIDVKITKDEERQEEKLVEEVKKEIKIPLFILDNFDILDNIVYKYNKYSKNNELFIQNFLEKIENSKNSLLGDLINKAINLDKENDDDK